MKKILLIIIILLCPVLVLAKDTCNCKDIIIKDIIKSELSGYTEEKQEPSINNNKIDLGLEMFNINDSITYDITIKNDSEEDYYFTNNSFNIDSDYLEYNLLNTSEIIKSKEEKTIQLKITYKNKIPEDSYNENKQMTITLGDEPLTNPDTKVQYIIIILIVLITSILFFISKKKSMKLLSVLLIPLIPIGAKALCSINLEINADITINEKEAIFLPGPEVNTKMKELAGDDISTQTSIFFDENIKSIKYSAIEPINSNKEEKNIVSMSDSPYPIYMWFDNGTIYWWSEAKRPKLNEDASYMFDHIKNLNDVLSIKKFDTSNVKNMNYMFTYTSSLYVIDALRDWDVSNVITMKAMFSSSSLNDLTCLENWNVSNVIDISQMFYGNKLESLKGLENWDVSRVENMGSSFSGMETLISIDNLKKWDTLNLVNLSSTFTNTGISDLSPLKKWDTSKVTTMSGTFKQCNQLTSLEGLEEWNVSNVTNFTRMFFITGVLDANSINDWDIQRTANFNFMFLDAPTHPEFTKVQGTWNSSGTFIPS